MKTAEPPVIVEQLFDVPIEDVWYAVTQQDQMVQWFFDNIPDFKAEVGFKTQFNVKAPSRDFMHLWEVTEVVPFKKIVTNWTYADCQGNSFVIFGLEEVDNQTQFTVINKVVEDFDDTIPEFKRESCVGGWNYFIKDKLVAYLKV